MICQFVIDYDHNGSELNGEFEYSGAMPRIGEMIFDGNKYFTVNNVVWSLFGTKPVFIHVTPVAYENPYGTT